MATTSGVADQILPLPKGGGALKGIGETFQPDLHTGTGNFSIPIAVPSGRNGFQPQLTLSYSTGNGNGPFGLGWSFGIPGVSRKTSKGIPRYEDNDTYILSGAEDLVLISDEVMATDREPERRQQYRPRTEGIFARIIHVTGNGKDQWEVTSKSGVRSIYGNADSSRVYDQDDVAHCRIFQWCLAESIDTNGNRIVYSYKREDGLTDAGDEELNHAYNQLYLSQIRYVNYLSGNQERFLFSVELDYGEYDEDGSPTGRWTSRLDRFSRYRAGFEIRTMRRCRRILIKVHDENAPSEGRLIKAYQLRYLNQLSDQEMDGDILPLNGVSLLAAVTLTGYRSDGAGNRLESSFPPVTFRYTRFEPESRSYETFTAREDALPARALNDPNHELVDLHGYGLPDVMQTSPAGYRYWRNLGNCQFDAPQLMSAAPAGVTLADDGVQFADMEGTGSADLLITKGRLNGYYRTTFDAKWDSRSFQIYTRAPSFDLKDADVRLVDMDGDGLVDALRTANPHLEVFYNRGAAGWDRQVQHVPRRRLEDFPDVYFSASDQRVRLASMTGDGMQDMVYVHDRLIQYWPNLGYGRWGRPITMRNAPQLPRQYDPRRLFLTDIDGDGYADLVYVDFGRVLFWMNQCGNGWSGCHAVEGTPGVTDLDSIRVADMKGNGTPGVLWTYDRATERESNYKYLDLTGGVKPYLLSETDNHLGATTRIAYAPSTTFYLADAAEERSWPVHLPFPVQVVEKVEIIDRISKGKLATRYAYHDGCWDGEEREFRGFGCVEQFDSETFAEYNNEGGGGGLEAFLPCPQRHFSPPTLTRTWFHLGCDVNGWRLPSTAEHPWSLPPELDRRGIREALRSLRGVILRTELYGLDASALESKPYRVTENRYDVELVARRLGNGDGPNSPGFAFFPQLHEEVTEEYERGDDLRVNRRILLYDEFGNLTKELKVGEPRVPGLPDDLLVLVTDNVYAGQDPANSYIKDRVSESLVRDPSPTDRSLIQSYLSGAGEPEWSQIGTVDAKTLAHTRNYYDGPPYQGLPSGQLSSGNLVRTESLALTPDILASAYPASAPGSYPEPPQSLANLKLLGYSSDAEGHWVQTQRKKYDFQDPTAGSSFGLAIGLQDPDGNEATVDFDLPYWLFPVRVTDAIGFSTTVDYDYQALAPSHQIDPNQNESEYAFDPLAMLCAVAVKGKQIGGVWEGDDLGKPTITVEYDLVAFANREQPIHSRSLQREEHKGNSCFETREYFDGFGRSIQKKVEAEPDPAGAPRWLGSGWQVYNNKGLVVERYEPFFSSTSDFEDNAKQGVNLTTHYDPLGRAVLTINPDGSFQQVLFGSLQDVTTPEGLKPNPWEFFAYDENDNGAFVYDSAGNRLSRSQAEIDALKIGDHLSTPKHTLEDAWGRRIDELDDNGVVGGVRQTYLTRFTYDPMGRVVAVTDPKGRPALHAVYDLLGRALRRESIDGGIAVSVIDAVGNVVEHADSKGARVLRSYDALNRLVTINARDDSNQPMGLRELHTYDRLSTVTPEQALANNSLGRIVQIYDGAGRLSLDGYDFKGNLLKKTRKVVDDNIAEAVWPDTGESDREKLLRSGTGFSIATSYDALNRVRELTYPDGALVSYRYNDGNLLQRIEVDGLAFVQDIQYNEKGQRTAIVDGNGVTTTYTYDPKTFRLIRLLSRTGNADPLQDLSYTFDPVGNVLGTDDQGRTRMENDRPYIANPREYSYDPLYRLTEATGTERKAIDNFLPPDAPFVSTNDITQCQPYERSYAYDEVGNILYEKSLRTQNQWMNTYSYEAGTNRLLETSVGTTTAPIPYRFDESGNMTGMMSNWNYFWDYADRMNGLENRPRKSSPTMEAQYLYGWDGIRVKKVLRKLHRSATTVSVDGIFEEYVERSGHSVIVQKNFKHVLDGTRRAAIIKTSLVSTEPDPEPPVLYHHADHLGSCEVVTDDQGAFFNQEEYYPYGETSFGSYARKRYRFIGKERDEESGLSYHEARYYIPWLGRWMSTDPLRISKERNPYAYCRANPVIFVDVNGQQTEQADQPTAQVCGPCIDTAGTGAPNRAAKLPYDRKKLEELGILPYDYKKYDQFFRAAEQGDLERTSRELEFEKLHPGPILKARDLKRERAYERWREEQDLLGEARKLATGLFFGALLVAKWSGPEVRWDPNDLRRRIKTGEWINSLLEGVWAHVERLEKENLSDKAPKDEPRKIVEQPLNLEGRPEVAPPATANPTLVVGNRLQVAVDWEMEGRIPLFAVELSPLAPDVRQSLSQPETRLVRPP